MTTLKRGAVKGRRPGPVAGGRLTRGPGQVPSPTERGKRHDVTENEPELLVEQGIAECLCDEQRGDSDHDPSPESLALGIPCFPKPADCPKPDPGGRDVHADEQREAHEPELREDREVRVVGHRVLEEGGMHLIQADVVGNVSGLELAEVVDSHADEWMVPRQARCDLPLVRPSAAAGRRDALEAHPLRRRGRQREVAHPSGDHDDQEDSEVRPQPPAEEKRYDHGGRETEQTRARLRHEDAQQARHDGSDRGETRNRPPCRRGERDRERDRGHERASEVVRVGDARDESVLGSEAGPDPVERCRHRARDIGPEGDPKVPGVAYCGIDDEQQRCDWDEPGEVAGRSGRVRSPQGGRRRPDQQP
ncbi:MAG: hypothetical protein M5U27_16265 [Gaiella sp.]|nr:hypothetical protein [Gaiella sp.]